MVLDVVSFPLAFLPAARLIILSTSAIVIALTCTTWPLIACTVARPFLVCSEVSNTSARGGSGGGSEGDLDESDAEAAG